ncbi:MAG: hypothetical protein ACRC1T_18245 [Clostridium chrysemydis]|uniref:hypothetical protein n=1 Tax=Clostridium chrysemydis TaxID=2665504 RepID=UPI003F30528C
MTKRLLAILLSVGILGGAFVGCGEKKEQPKEPQKQEETQAEQKKDNTIDLIGSDEYKKINTVMPFKILKMSENSDKEFKSLSIEFDVKKGNIKDEIKEFKTNAELIASYVSTQLKDKDYKMLILSNPEVGGIITYTQKEELNNYMTTDGASFGDSNNQKIYDNLN